MAATDWETLTDRIYEAAVVPELWRPLLGDFAAMTDSAFGCLVAFGAGATNWIGTPEADALIRAHVLLPTPIENPRLTRGFELRHPGFVQDTDALPLEEIPVHPFYRDFLYPRGYGWCLGTFIELPDGERIAINVERRREGGPYATDLVRRVDGFRPHFARAALLSARLGLDRARATAAALDAVGLAAAVLQGRGRIAAANPRLEKLMPGAILDRRDRMALVDKAADRLFEAALGQIGQDHDHRPRLVRSVPVAASASQPPMIVHLVPIRGIAHDVFARSTAIAIVTPVEVRALSGIEPLLQALFDLTPAEARVARGIGSALTVDEIAADAGLSRETVRNQLKAVLAKTGTRRQAELANLLAGSRLP